MPASLTITPKTALFDQPVSIRASGLQPGQTVRLEAAVEFPWTPGTLWKSSAVYSADGQGELHLVSSEPSTQEDSALDPMRLFWALQPVTQVSLTGTPELDTRQPLRMTFTLTGESQEPAVETIERCMQLPEIQASPYTADGAHGRFFYQPDGRPRPGILFLSGSGELSPILPISALLASYGYSVLALAPGPDVQIQGQQEIPIEPFVTAISWLGQQFAVSKDRIGVIGGSKGGELALLVGSLDSKVKAVAAIAPSSVIFSEIGASFKPKSARSAWSFHGQPLPFATIRLKTLIFEILSQAVRGRAFRFSPAYRAALRNPRSYQQAVIPIESIQGPILLVSGTDDGYWPATDFCQIALQRLKDNSFTYPVYHLGYAGAGHSFYAPYLLPTAAIENRVLPGVRFSSGGTPEINSRAQSDSWPKILRFFKTHLQDLP